MTNQIEITLIFSAVIVGVLSAAYFYLATDIFINLLKIPLKLISAGMLIISAGVLLSAFISYESSQGIILTLSGYPLSVYFYILYIIGSLLIAFGARGFTHRTNTRVL